MKTLIPYAAAAAFVCLTLATPARADRLDAVVPIKGTVGVEVERPGEVVTVGIVLAKAATSKVKLSIKTAKKSPLELDVKLIAPDGTEFNVAGAGGKLKSKSKSWSAKFTGVSQAGLWRFEIRGLQGSTGGATIKTAVAEKGKLKSDLIVPISSFAEVPFSVGEDSEVTVSLKRGKGARLVTNIQIVDPNGELLVADGDAKVSNKSGASKLSKFRLPLAGDYTLEIRGETGLGGGVKYSIASKTAKIKGEVPVADPGPGADGEVGTEVRLSAVDSGAGAGAVYRWTQISGEPVQLSDPRSMSPTFMAPATSSSLAFQLSVENAFGVLSHAVGHAVEIGPRPVADAGRSQAVALGAQVALDAGASLSRNGRALRFFWAQDPADAQQVVLDDPTGPAPTFTAPSTDASLRFDLIADDGDVRSFRDRVVVSVGAANRAADAGREQYVGRMASVHLNALASIRPGGVLDGGLTWQQVGGPDVTLGGAAYAPTFTAPRQPADLIFQLTVDGDASTADTVNVHVRTAETNGAPAGIATHPGAASGTTVALNVTGSDPNGDDPSFRWGQISGPAAPLSGADSSGPEATLPGLDGLHVFAVIANDGLANGAPDVATAYGNAFVDAPIADAGADRTVSSGQRVNLSGTNSMRTDGGVDPLTFAWEQVSGLDWYDVAAQDPGFDPTGSAPGFTLPDAVSSLTTRRTITFQLVVDDGIAASEPDLVTATFTNLPLNGVPSVTASASTDNPIAGARVDLMSTVLELDGDPITRRWEQISGPAVTLQPNATSAAPHFFAPASGAIVLRFTASDPFDTSLPANVSVTVDAAPTASVSISPTVGSIGETVTVDGRGSSDPEGAITYTWTKLEGPDTITFDPTAEFFSFTAPDGTVRFQLVVNDGRQDSQPATGTFSTIVPPEVSPTASKQKAPYGASMSLAANPGDTGFTFEWRVISKSAGLPTINLSSTTAQNPTFTAPLPTSAPFGGSDFNGPNESLPQATFGVIATNGALESDEETVVVKFFASLDDASTTSVNRVRGIISGNCTQCHSGSSSASCGSGTNASFFPMDSKTRILNAVNANATCGGSQQSKRVNPGSPSGSELQRRIDTTGSGRMPPGGQINATSRNIISDWISQGSKDN